MDMPLGEVVIRAQHELRGEMREETAANAGVQTGDDLGAGVGLDVEGPAVSEWTLNIVDLGRRESKAAAEKPGRGVAQRSERALRFSI